MFDFLCFSMRSRETRAPARAPTLYRRFLPRCGIRFDPATAARGSPATCGSARARICRVSMVVKKKNSREPALFPPYPSPPPYPTRTSTNSCSFAEYWHHDPVSSCPLSCSGSWSFQVAYYFGCLPVACVFLSFFSIFFGSENSALWLW